MLNVKHKGTQQIVPHAVSKTEIFILTTVTSDIHNTCVQVCSMI